MTEGDPPDGPRQPHHFVEPPHLVCLECGPRIFGPIVRSFNLIENEECEICATQTQVVHASIFRDYTDMFSRR
jgi:hypothetical protein